MADLKQQNEKQLEILLLISVVLAYISIVVLCPREILLLSSNNPIILRLNLVAIGLSPIVCLKAILVLLPDFVNQEWKERLVHFRWNNPLPGCRADKLILLNSRIDTDNLPDPIKKLMDPSLTPQERNAHWYKKIYLPVKDLDSVSSAHRKYLLYRDAASGTLLIFLLIGLLDLIMRFTYDHMVISSVAYLFQIVYMTLLIGCACQKGNRMVTNAIANFNQTKGDNQ